jgi:hypothetical protein
MINKLRWIPIVVLLSFVCVNSSYATIQSHLNFQGFLVKSDGEPVTDGTYNLTVSLWDGPDDGTANKLWDESHSVTVTRGIYSLSLGANEPFPNTMTFTSQYYLGVQVSDGPIMKQDGALIPLTSTWTAFRAKTAGGRCIKEKSEDYPITDDDDIILVTGNTTLTLPSASSFNSRIFTIKKLDDSTTVSVKTSSSETIDGTNHGTGGTPLTISNQYDELSVISDGDQWISIGKSFGLESMATQPSDSVDIDGGAIDDTAIGANTASTGNFTNVSVTGTFTYGGNSLDTMATQSSSSVDISGGEIDDTPIGANTASTGNFTNLTVTGAFTYGGNSLDSMATQPSDSVDISGGEIDDTEIGTTTPSTGKFSNLTTTGTTTIESATMTLGKGTTASPGQIILHDNQAGDSFTTTIQAADDVDANITFTLPSTAGSAEQLLTTDGSGTLTWVTSPLSSITITTAGEEILDDNDAAAQRTTLGLDSMATQPSDSVDISGGEIDDTEIGTTTPSTGKFSNLTTTGTTTIESATMTLGKGTTASPGQIILHDNQAGDSFTTTIKAADDVDANITFTLPSTAGSADQLLTTDGTGTLTWVTDQLSSITVTTAGKAILDDADDSAQRTTLGLDSMATQPSDSVDISGGEIDDTEIGTTTPSTGKFSNLTTTGTTTIESATMTLGKGTTASPGQIILHDNQAGDSFTTTIKAADDVDANITFTLPSTAGTANQLLTTDGSGTLTWVTDQLSSITVTTAGKAILDDADDSAQRTTLGLKSMATQASDSVAISGGEIDGTTIGATTQAEAKFTTVTVSDYIYLGTPAINSWRFAIDTNNLQFQQNTVDGWVSRYTITNAGGENP